MRSFLAALLFALTFALTPTAQAQDISAEEHFNQAEAYFKVRDYEQALTHYKAAYLSSLAPELLFNMAQCYRFLGKYEDAMGTYKTFLRDLPETPMKSDVENIMKEMQELMDKQKSTQNATPVNSLNPNITSASQPINPNINNDKPEPPPTKAMNPNTPKFILYGAGGAAGTGLVLGIASFSLAKKANAAQLEGKPANEFAAQFRNAQVLAGISDALFIGAALTGSVGALLLVKTKKAEASLSVQPTSVALQLNF